MFIHPQGREYTGAEGAALLPWDQPQCKIARQTSNPISWRVKTSFPLSCHFELRWTPEPGQDTDGRLCCSGALCRLWISDPHLWSPVPQIILSSNPAATRRLHRVTPPSQGETMMPVVKAKGQTHLGSDPSWVTQESSSFLRLRVASELAFPCHWG